MTTFDGILPQLAGIFDRYGQDVATAGPLVVNRDLNGRMRLIADERRKDAPETLAALDRISREIHAALGPHAYPPESAVLFEADLPDMFPAHQTFPLEGYPDVRVIDRLAAEANWSAIPPLPLAGPQRIVFYSIKGGVGRSTALAATAWALAESGQRVLVLDLDLESPGLSSSLLPEDRRPAYGITDWLVEDLVDNGDAVFGDLVATSELSHNGEILVVPAHGRDPGEYVAKLGRIWMPKLDRQGGREAWPQRLRRLLDALEGRWAPDVVLIDARAGIDEVASACITALGASLILLFAIDGDQTWSGYRTLFRHWRRTGVVRDVRERLQVVGAMIPEVDAAEYSDGLLERAWDACSEELYDDVPAGSISGVGDLWSFDQTDESAPHYPWAVKWHRGFAALRSLHGRLHGIDPAEVQQVFGPLIEGIRLSVDSGRGDA